MWFLLALECFPPLFFFGWCLHRRIAFLSAYWHTLGRAVPSEVGRSFMMISPIEVHIPDTFAEVFRANRGPPWLVGEWCYWQASKLLLASKGKAAAVAWWMDSFAEVLLVRWSGFCILGLKTFPGCIVIVTICWEWYCNNAFNISVWCRVIQVKDLHGRINLRFVEYAIVLLHLKGVTKVKTEDKCFFDYKMKIKHNTNI